VPGMSTGEGVPFRSFRGETRLLAVVTHELRRDTEISREKYSGSSPARRYWAVTLRALHFIQLAPRVHSNKSVTFIR
jgi:hypothetical protein